MPRITRNRAVWAASAALAIAAVTGLGVSAPGAFAKTTAGHSSKTSTPIKHLVVIFDENVSFDHYFGTYPNAANTDGTTFTAAAGTPIPNNYTSHPNLLTANPNSFQPQRLAPSQAMTCSQNHGYNPEQRAINGGLMNKFPESTQSAGCSPSTLFNAPGAVMDYYDGNTVTAEWNYAQNFAMSDNSWDSTFGPSTPGALNLISGQTHGALAVNSVTGAPITGAGAPGQVSSPNANGIGTVNADPDPSYDDCADNNHTSTSALVQMQGKNIGDLLNAKGVTWGWFQGGFAPSTPYNAATKTMAQCKTTATNIGGAAVNSYSAHHNPFAYYASTSNPHHLPPTSVKAIGHTDQANHNYDLTNFDAALKTNNLPAVSYLKAPAAQDGHPGNSNPIDEQAFLVKEINAIQQSPDWKSTAIVLAYDDSDGWYDHVAPTILNGSKDTTASGDTTLCSASTAPIAGGYADRCGPSQRLPLLVISPFAKQNFVDSTRTTQASVLKFVEDNWSTGRIGNSSFDATAGTITNMMDFTHPQKRKVLLNANGSVASKTK
ncbi:MAG: phospholipase [Microbacteriaceae bacterium]|jgi:phospholipase C|nr:phospholipase [Microbacteriaceae bacterium]